MTAIGALFAMIAEPLRKTIIEVLEESAGPSSGFSKTHKLIVFNNDTNTFDEVTLILTEIGIELELAREYTWEIDARGSAEVFWGSLEECESKAKTISSIGIQTEVCRIDE